MLCAGVAEMAYMEPGKDIVFLSSRTGFVRIALQHGELFMGASKPHPHSIILTRGFKIASATDTPC